jgi:hypothetical protein
MPAPLSPNLYLAVYTALDITNTNMKKKSDQGFQSAQFSTIKTFDSLTGLTPNASYNFKISVDGSPLVTVTFTHTILVSQGFTDSYLFLIDNIQKRLDALVIPAQVILDPASFPLAGSMKFLSKTKGLASACLIQSAATNDMFTALTDFTGFDTPVTGIGNPLEIEYNIELATNLSNQLFTYFNAFLLGPNAAKTYSVSGGQITIPKDDFGLDAQ